MSFSTALAIVLLLVVFVLAATMANLLARITRLERMQGELLRGPGPGPSPVELGDQPAPEAVRSLIGARDEAHIVLLSPQCPACDDAVEAVAAWPEDVRRATFLTYRDEPSDRFVAPPGARVAAGAQAVFDALAVRSTPALVRVKDGLVVQRILGVPAEPAGPHAGTSNGNGTHHHDHDGPRRQEAS